MKDDNVKVAFDPPCEYKRSRKSFWLDFGGRSVQLPQSHTELVTEDNLVDAVILPRWLAVDRGLVEAHDVVSLREDAHNDTMSRWDWYLLGATLVFLGRSGYTMAEAVWQGKKAARMLLETAKEEE